MEFEKYNKETAYNLTQSYELVNAKFNISALSLNIFYIIAMQISSEDKELKSYLLKKGDLEYILNKSIDFRDMKKAIRSLASTTIELTERNSKDTRVQSLFVDIHYKDSTGFLSATINPLIKDHFLGLKKNFVTADFINFISKIHGSYSKRMYLLFKQKQKLARSEYLVSELQNILDTPKSLNSYGNFKKRVLDKAIEEVNRFTDLVVSYEEIKTGRAVTSIKFLISRNKKSYEVEAAKAERKKLREEKKAASAKFSQETKQASNTTEIIRDLCSWIDE